MTVSIPPRKLSNMTMCNKPAGFRGRCVKLPEHAGNCSVQDTEDLKTDRAAYRRLILAGLLP